MCGGRLHSSSGLEIFQLDMEEEKTHFTQLIRLLVFTLPFMHSEAGFLTFFCGRV